MFIEIFLANYQGKKTYQISKSDENSIQKDIESIYQNWMDINEGHFHPTCLSVSFEKDDGTKINLFNKYNQEIPTFSHDFIGKSEFFPNKVLSSIKDLKIKLNMKL